MDNLNTKQKIIIGIIIILMLLVIGFYIMQKTKTSEKFNTDSAIETDVGANFVRPQETTQIIIHIAGEIKQPGIIHLEEGARIADAIEKAGGTMQEADLTKVNLAYILEDGQKVYIPNKNEKEEIIVTEGVGEDIILLQEGKTEKININKASQTELETLSGVGSSTALKIIEYRKQNGKFKKVEEIMNVPGIGEAKFETIKDFITI